MLEAYLKYWRNYVNFNGRSSRTDYWWVVLSNVIIGLIFGLIVLIFLAGSLKTGSLDSLMGVTLFFYAISGIWGLVNLLPGIGMMVRRMRDANIHWAFIFLGLIPAAGGIILFVFTLLPTNDGEYNTGVAKDSEVVLQDKYHANPKINYAAAFESEQMPSHMELPLEFWHYK